MGLPADDLCLENAVVLERFSHRFPLVVDPAGQATRFLLNKYKVLHHLIISFVDRGVLASLNLCIGLEQNSSVNFPTGVPQPSLKRLNTFLRNEIYLTGSTPLRCC